MYITNYWQNWRARNGLISTRGILALRDLWDPLARNSKTTEHDEGHIKGHTTASSQGHSFV